ncbi:MAG: recombinase family protein [Eubacteriaceae bacterium]|nr:recombinase family protein [Eubacteriaceae bacterium]
MKTAIYVRVSTDEQAKEGYSIRAQIEKLKSFIKVKDWSFYKVYADEGISGKNIKDRPAINEMIEDIKAGNVDNVLVYKIDRLTRSTRDLIELTDIFKATGCSFNSVMESIDTATASGRMFLKIIGIFAEFERENIAERITLAAEKKAREGYSLGYFTASYGYDKAGKDKIQTINLEEAKIVKEIFAMYVEGNMSQNAITKNLNKRGIKPKLSETWCAESVRGVLRNTNYIGKVRYSLNNEERYFEADGKHEPIIDEEVFLQAQSKMVRIQKKMPTKRPKEASFFSGTIYCGKCGTKLVTHNYYITTKKGEGLVRGGYRCPNHNKGLCTIGRISHRKVERAFQDYIDGIEDLTAIDDEMLEQENKQDKINALLREEAEKAIAKIEKKERDVMNLYLEEQLTFAQYSEMTKKLADDKAFHTQQLSNIPSETKEDIRITKVDVITNFQMNWQNLTDTEKLLFVQDCIEKITVIRGEKQEAVIKGVDFY